MRFNVNMLFWSCTMAYCVIFWVAVAGCVSTKMRDVPNLMAQLERDAIGKDDLTMLLGVSMLPELEFTPGRYGTVHVWNMPELADVEGGLPVMQRPILRPVKGKPWSIGWLTSYVPPRPNVQTALLVSLRRPGEPQPIYGAAGAMLQVPPDYVLVPERVEDIDPASRPGVPFELVQDNEGRVMLRVVWPEMLSGLTAWCQLLVADGRVPAGCVSTPMLEIHVGDL